MPPPRIARTLRRAASIAAAPQLDRPLAALWLVLMCAIGTSSIAGASPVPWGGVGDDIDGLRSVPLRSAAGAIRCSAAPAANGYHTAGHCLAQVPPFRIDGETVTGWSTDPVRDLGHVATAGAPSTVPAVTLAVGETVTARMWDGSDIVLRYAAPASCIVSGADVISGPPGSLPGGWPCASLCVENGRAVHGGDSGSGLWAHGGVWGVIVAAERRASSADDLCGAGQLVIVVPVP